MKELIQELKNKLSYRLTVDEVFDLINFYHDNNIDFTLLFNDDDTVSINFCFELVFDDDK